MMRILVHVEGHTEEEFVNSVLVVAPHLYSKGFASVSARLIGGSRSRKRRGACPWPKNTSRLRLPHRELPENQKKVIALDYGMYSGEAKIVIGLALLYYALKCLGLDTDLAARQTQDQQIVLLSRDEVPGTKGSI